MMAKVCQQLCVSFSSGQSIMMRIAKRSYTPSNAQCCFFIFCQMLCIDFVRPFMWNFSPAAFSFCSIGVMKSAIYASRASFVALSFSLMW